MITRAPRTDLRAMFFFGGFTAIRRQPRRGGKASRRLPCATYSGMRHARNSQTKVAAKNSATGAEAWVEQIANPVLRQNAAESVFWRISDRAYAREWMRNLKGVEPERQARFLRNML